MQAKDVMVFIDPGYPVYYRNEMFEATSKWNRDGQIEPSILLRERLARKGISVNTADYLVDRQIVGKVNIYASLGLMANYRKLSKQSNVYLQSFYILEPPTVAPQQYREIGNLTKYFDNVYVHNTEGGGYERYYGNHPNLRKVYSPQIRDRVIDELWNNQDRGFLTMINSRKAKPPCVRLVRRRSPGSFPITVAKNPGLKDGGLYAERIRALVALRKLGGIDLYGYDWGASLCTILRNIPRTQSFPWLYWKHRKELGSIYKGAVGSKHETLSRYTFSICFENEAMPGWITEKVFDCFYVGTIPVYLGAPDIEKYVPKGCFIDMRDFDSYDELHAYLLSLSDKDVQSFREAGREYLSSEQYRPFTKESFVEQFQTDLRQTLEANGLTLPNL